MDRYPRDFDWDEWNRAHVLDRHGIFPDEAQEPFDDPKVVRVPTPRIDGERRQAIVGHTNNDRLLFIVFTMRRGLVRIISARDANEAERRQYRRSKG